MVRIPRRSLQIPRAIGWAIVPLGRKTAASLPRRSPTRRTTRSVPSPPPVASASAASWSRTGGVPCHTLRCRCAPAIAGRIRASSTTATSLRVLEAAKRCRDEARQGLEVVAALEHGTNPRSELRRAAGELLEPDLGHLHVRERVLDVRVEACGDEDKVRIERSHGRLHELHEGSEVLAVARAGWERNVERRLVARA